MGIIKFPFSLISVPPGMGTCVYKFSDCKHTCAECGYEFIEDEKTREIVIGHPEDECLIRRIMMS